MCVCVLWVCVQLAKALYSLGTASILASATRLEAMPYMEEAVAIFEDPKNGLTARSVRNVMYMCSARSMLLTSYHKLGRYDDAAAIAKGIMQACQVSTTQVSREMCPRIKNKRLHVSYPCRVSSCRERTVPYTKTGCETKSMPSGG